MLTSLFTALMLLATLLIEETFMAALPLPWRETPILLVVALVIMDRVSVELGVTFFLSGTVIAYAWGMTGPVPMVIALLTMAGAVFFSKRVFARRSLAAFFGFALGASTTYEVCIGLERLIQRVPVNVLAYFFLVMFSAVCALFLLLFVDTVSRSIGLRFVRKETTYEVEQS